MITQIRETEWKYDAAPGSALPDLTGLPQVVTQSEPDEQRLEATYYDTPDLRLIRAGITLRQRGGGDDAGWHLKLPVRSGTRLELRQPPGEELPAEFSPLLRARLRGRPVQPVARIETRRSRRRLRDETGSTLAEVVVDSVTAETFGETTTLTRWNEVEVELADGGRGLLKAADKQLRGGGLHRSRYASKLEAALAVAGMLPEPVPEPEPTASSSAADALLAYLRTQVEELVSWDPLVRRDEPDAVHSMRVASRRLRSTLQSFRRILRPDEVRGLIEDLKWLGALLGEARDDEVMAEHLVAQVEQVPSELVLGPVEARVVGHYAPLRAAAHRILIEALDSDRYLALLLRLDGLLAAPPLSPKAEKPAADALPPLVGRALRRVRHRMDQARNEHAGPGRDAALHEARKAAKRARYAAETAEPVVGEDARRSAKSLKRLQSTLGEHQDAVIAGEAVRLLGVRAHADGENAFTYGLLYEREAERRADLQDRARKAWKRANRSRRTAWMS